MSPLEDRRPSDADDRPATEVEDDHDDAIVDEPALAALPLEADETDVLDQRAIVGTAEDDRHS